MAIHRLAVAPPTQLAIPLRAVRLVEKSSVADPQRSSRRRAGTRRIAAGELTRKPGMALLIRRAAR